MKAVKITLIAVAALLLAAGVSTTSYAFHGGGVAECSGCHSMHSSGKPDATTLKGDATNSVFLLKGTDQSSACLTCHDGPDLSSYHVSDSSAPSGEAPSNRTPGGDFGWLKKTYTWAGRGGATVTEEGHAHGHNIKAADYGYEVQADPTKAPGGDFLSSGLGCQSCHDPHSGNRRLSDGSYVQRQALGTVGSPILRSGSYHNGVAPGAGEAVGVYRLLRGLGDSSQGATFSGVFIAVAPSTYNQSEATDQVRVAYGADGANTVSKWCASCHTNMHTDSDKLVHPVDKTLGTGDTGMHVNYNAYVKSGDLSGTAATSFSSLVPFAEATGTIATLQSHARNNDSVLNGPASSDTVVCLSCHRAHASGWEYAMRWNPEYEFLTDTAGLYYNSGYGGRGRTIPEVQASYYDRDSTVFAKSQRSLCNKCHAKD